MSLFDALLLDPCKTNVFIANRTDNVGGTGTISDPFDGSTQTKFDTVMSGLSANTRVHLGPGTFQTNGYADGLSGGFQPKAGMKIVGSGIDVTTLRIVGGGTASKHYYAIGAPTGTQLDYLEVSDMTIDCNLSNLTASTIASGGIRVTGNYTRVRRVKVIGWGAKTSGPACFVVALLTADPASSIAALTNPGIEDCIGINPDSNTNSGVSTAVFHIGPKDDAGYTVVPRITASDHSSVIASWIAAVSQASQRVQSYLCATTPGSTRLQVPLDNTCIQ
jgi:hypothetical protein